MYNFEVIVEEGEKRIKFDTSSARIIFRKPKFIYMSASAKPEAFDWTAWTSNNASVNLSQLFKCLAQITDDVFVAVRNDDKILNHQLKIINLEAELKAQKLKISSEKDKLIKLQKSGTIE